MKRNKTFVASVIVFLVLFILIGCAPEVPNITNEDNALANVLTQEYELGELDDFLKSRNTNIYHQSLNDPERILFYNELNEKFPVELLRYDNNSANAAYTVYKVHQGGYYYVFWTHAYQNIENYSYFPTRDWTDTENMCVYFSTYIHTPKRRIDFLPLRFGTKTAADVISIDPYCQFQELAASMRSLSLLSEELVLQVTYTYDERYHSDFDYEYLIIKEISVIPREKAGCFGYISPEDLPFS